MYISPPKDYRKCVGIVMCNADKQVFVAARKDLKDDAWQMPQGGIDKGETAEEALYRELLEEIGTNSITPIATSAYWYTYDFPHPVHGKRNKYKGQAQKWFLARFTGHDRDINLETDHPEFKKWRWIPFAETIDLIVDFKRPVYQAVYDEFTPALSAL
jgi:putative (di)nucleoside polyphosphate hydrolase